MQLITKNINCFLKTIVDPFINNLSQRDEVLGIALLGGLGMRNFSDDFSDIDVSVLIEDTKKDFFPLPFEFHYYCDDYIAEFNINTLVYGDEKKEQWNHSKIEAYENARIVYDPQGKLRDLLAEKVVFDESEAFERLVWIVQQYRWRAQVHTLRTFHRGYPEGAQFVLNVCLEMLIECVFLLNKQYLPHCKWIFIKLKELNHFGLYNHFSKCIMISGLTLESISERLEIMDTIFNTLLLEIKKMYPFFPDNPYDYFIKKHKHIQAIPPIEKLCQSNPDFQRLSNIAKQRVFGNICYNICNSFEKNNEYLTELIKKEKING